MMGIASPGRLSKFLPIVRWLPGCPSGDIRADVVAGLALAGLLVPEGMAYAGIAGVPPQAGLYSVAVGLFVYALFGSSRQLAVSPTSGSAAMLAALVGPLALGDAGLYAALASGTAIAAGLLLLLGSIFKLGFVSEFISKPVLKGFVFGLALTIMIKQAPKLLGIEKGSGDALHQAWHVVTSLGQINFWTMAVGASALAVLFVLGAYVPRLPSALVVLVFGILSVEWFKLDRHHVEIVSSIPTGLPVPGIPSITSEQWPDLFAGAAGIVLIVYAEALAAGRTFAGKHHYEIDPNQELAALGAANIASGLTQGIIVGGGMSGTAANDAGGARTQLSAIATSLAVILTLLFLMPLFHNLPEAVLGAIVIHAIWHLADVKELRRFAMLRTGSIWSALIALTGVLMLGVLRGLILAVLLTIAALMKKISAPQDSVLGRLPNTGNFVDIARHPNAKLIPGLLIFRPNGPMFFANANRIHNRLRTLIKESESPVRAVILNLEASLETDVTTLDMLQQLKTELDEAGAELVFARVSDNAYDLFRRGGLLARVGEDRVFLGVDSAVAAFYQDTR
jgi:sulfate permease, SulP family